MRFSVSAVDLKTGVSLVSHALSARPARPIFEGMLLESVDDGIRLTCTDGEMVIQTLVSATIAEEGCAVLPAKLFGELLNKLSGDVTVSTNREMRATISAVLSDTTMMGMDASEFPEINPVQASFTATMPQRALRDAVSKVMFAISIEEARRILTGCLMEVYANETRFVGLDGFRLSLQRVFVTHTLPEKQEFIQMVVPGRIMGEFSRMLAETDEPVEVCFNAERMMMSFGETRCQTATLTGEYINYKQILPVSWKHEVKMRRGDFLSAIERAALIAREGKNNLIKLKLTGDLMLITASTERGAALEQIPITYNQQEEISIAFNARYLSEVIRNVDTDAMCMRFNSNVSPCVVAPIEGNQFTYLVLPVRVYDGE